MTDAKNMDCGSIDRLLDERVPQGGCPSVEQVLKAARDAGWTVAPPGDTESGSHVHQIGQAPPLFVVMMEHPEVEKPEFWAPTQASGAAQLKFTHADHRRQGLDRECEGNAIHRVVEYVPWALECRPVALTVPDVERIVAWASLWRGCHDPHWSRDDDELFGRLQDIAHGLTEQESVGREGGDR